MNLKLTKKQEQALVNLGLETLLNGATQTVPARIPWNKGKKMRKTSRKWSKEQHKKYAETMARKWGKIRSKP